MTRLVWLACAAAVSAGAQTTASTPGERDFRQLCGSCHGAAAQGGEKGPALVGSRSLRSRSEAQIRDIIKNGTSNGMPAFGALPGASLDAVAHWVHSLNTSAFDSKPEGDIAAGERVFFGQGRCGTCHTAAGRGAAGGPDLSSVGKSLTAHDLERGMSHAAFKESPAATGFEPVTIRLRDKSVLRGYVRKRGIHELQLQTYDGRWRFLQNSRRFKSASYEPVSKVPPPPPSFASALPCQVSDPGSPGRGTVQNRHTSFPVAAL
jgi:mono/diheme cytochrome c family protein